MSSHWKQRHLLYSAVCPVTENKDIYRILLYVQSLKTKTSTVFCCMSSHWKQRHLLYSAVCPVTENKVSAGPQNAQRHRSCGNIVPESKANRRQGWERGEKHTQQQQQPSLKRWSLYSKKMNRTPFYREIRTAPRCCERQMCVNYRGCTGP